MPYLADPETALLFLFIVIYPLIPSLVSAYVNVGQEPD